MQQATTNELNNFIHIYNEDSSYLDEYIDPNSVDLVVTSPPYNIGQPYDKHEDTMNYDEYLAFLQRVFEKVFIVMKDDGRACVNIGDATTDKQYYPLHSDFTQLMKGIGFKTRKTIIWDKKHCHNRQAWGSWKSASCPNVIQPFEYILVFDKKYKKKQQKGTSDIKDHEFAEWSYGIWVITATPNIHHPCSFPEELPERLVKLYSYVGDLVLDPFLGSGTTLRMAKKFQRNGIGFDISARYCKIAYKLLNPTQRSLFPKYEYEIKIFKGKKRA